MTILLYIIHYYFCSTVSSAVSCCRSYLRLLSLLLCNWGEKEKFESVWESSWLQSPDLYSKVIYCIYIMNALSYSWSFIKTDQLKPKEMGIYHAELYWSMSTRDLPWPRSCCSSTTLQLWFNGKWTSGDIPRTSSLHSTSSCPRSLMALQEYLPPSNRLGLRMFRVNTPWLFCIRNLGSSPMIILFFIQMIFGCRTVCCRRKHNWRGEGSV